MSVLDKGDVERFFPKQGVSVYDSFRPHSGIRYTLSQTETEFNAGVPFVHLTQTQVEYEPGQDLTPPTRAELINWQKNKKRGPVWRFLEEIRDRKIAEEVAKRRDIYVASNKLVKKDYRRRQNDVHKEIISRIGPNWYMELSNRQFDVADNLKHALLRDYRLKTIINTQEALTDLGIVLRPNHTCIRYAVNKCYNCPVEFLLTLFKITNPKRKNYTVSDKILLSSVVHLTIRDTLKELHIRIPSPPRAKEKKKRKPYTGPPKYDKNRSPYLQPFYFNKQETVNYVYKNRHKEYPYSRYFNYQDEMFEWYEDTSQPIEDFEKTFENIRVVSKYAQPPKIPVRLITRIKPKPKMLQRMIKPSAYVSKCKNIDLDMDKHKGELLLINTNINPETLCKCPDLNGTRDFTLHVKISTASERLHFEQDVAPFDKKKPGKIKIQQVVKKEPPEENREERITVLGSIKQKKPCVCQIHNVCQYGQGDVCKCYQPAEDEQESEETVTGETTTTTDTTGTQETTTDSCICSRDSQDASDERPLDECVCSSSSDEPEGPAPPTLQEQLDASVCVCGQQRMQRIPSRCICSSEDSSDSVDRQGCTCHLNKDSSSEVSYSDVDPCECFGEKKVRRNEDGCTCSLPPKKPRPKPKDDFCEAPLEKDPGCTCMTGDGAAKRVCRCLEDPDNVCFCAEKLDLNKVCRCVVPNRAYVRNIPKDVCTCCNPDLEKIDRYYRCTCMGVPQPPAPPRPKPPKPPLPEKIKKKRKKKYIPPCLLDSGDKKKRTNTCTCDRERPECTCGDSTSDSAVSPVRSFDAPVTCTCGSSDETLEYIKTTYKKKQEDYKAGLPPKKRSKPKKNRHRSVDPDCLCDEGPESVQTPRQTSPGRQASPSDRIRPSPDSSRRPSPDGSRWPSPDSGRRQASPCGQPSRDSSPRGGKGSRRSSPCDGSQAPPPMKICPEIYSSKYEQGLEFREKDVRQKKLLEMYLKTQKPKTEAEAKSKYQVEEQKPQKGILNPRRKSTTSEVKSSGLLEKSLNRKSKEIHFGSDYRVIPLGMDQSNESNETEQEVEINNDKCKCEKIMQQFLREHDECIALYDEYQFQIYQRIEEYFDDLKDDGCNCIDYEKYPTGSPDTCARKPLPCVAEDSYQSPDRFSYQTKIISPDPCATICFDGDDDDYYVENVIRSKESTRDKCCACCSACLMTDSVPRLGHCDCLEMLQDDDGCICLRSDSDEPFWDFKICDYPALWPCTCDKEKKKGKKGKKNEDEKKLEQQSSKIFNIAKFPIKYEDQINLLKMALTTLAQDNYPLAKLPDCHLLPHFKLWLNLRSKKYISMEKREKLNQYSKSIWYHTQVCQRKVWYPQMGVTAHQIEKMTWKAYKKYHRMINNCKEYYYRKLKQGYISEAQEFYTTLFHHELHNKTFRDCYFAYLPSDENHLFVINPWQRHECKDLSRRVPCI